MKLLLQDWPEGGAPLGLGMILLLLFLFWFFVLDGKTTVELKLGEYKNPPPDPLPRPKTSVNRGLAAPRNRDL